MDGKTLPEVCAFQWAGCHRRCLDDVADLDHARYLRIRFEDLMEDPSSELSKIASWAQLDPKPFRRLGRGLPRINVTKHTPPVAVPIEEIRATLPLVGDVARELGYDAT